MVGCEVSNINQGGLSGISTQSSSVQKLPDLPSVSLLPSSSCLSATCDHTRFQPCEQLRVTLILQKKVRARGQPPNNLYPGSAPTALLQGDLGTALSNSIFPGRKCRPRRGDVPRFHGGFGTKYRTASSCFVFETRTCRISQAGLKLKALLCRSPELQGTRHQVHSTVPGASCMVGSIEYVHVGGRSLHRALLRMSEHPDLAQLGRYLPL